MEIIIQRKRTTTEQLTSFMRESKFNTLTVNISSRLEKHNDIQTYIPLASVHYLYIRA